MKRYSHIVFDIDGTLIDSEIAVISSLRTTLQTLTGKYYTHDELRFVLGITGEDAIKRLGLSNVGLVLDLWNRNMKAEIITHPLRLFPGIKECIETLYNHGISLGLVTSKTNEEFDNDFNSFGIRSFFTACVCADGTIKHKPDAEPILKYLTKTGIDAPDILYIGDAVYDAECARNAGIDFALALWGNNSSNIKADYYLNTPQEIYDLTY